MQESLAPCFRASLAKPKFGVKIPGMPSSPLSLSHTQLELWPLFHCRLTQGHNDEEEHPNHFIPTKTRQRFPPIPFKPPIRQSHLLVNTCLQLYVSFLGQIPTLTDGKTLPITTLPSPSLHSIGPTSQPLTPISPNPPFLRVKLGRG